jgi:hypothetical protein
MMFCNREHFCALCHGFSVVASCWSLRYTDHFLRHVLKKNQTSSSFPFPFVPLQRRGCLVAPWFLWIVLVPCKRYTPWRRLGERRYSSYSFSTSALDRGERSASRTGRSFTRGERTPGTHCTGGWVGPRAGLDTEARRKTLSPLSGIEPRSPGRPARSQTLYCLS